MGSVCCCFGVSDDESSESASSFCCLNFRFEDFLLKYEALFGGEETQDFDLADSEDMTISQNNGDSRSPPAHQEIGTWKLEKGSSHSHMRNADLKLLRELMKLENKLEGDEKKDYIAPNKHLFWDVETKYHCPLQEDEDVCPTCLEEYTIENPKIITKCSHHYHLSCIYEWQERSETCPFCGAVMEFEETS
ncbi:unnamed protein product [Cuscuta campestris]|uniref:RING-type E3 ubiquitin transferase n=1 Tax=Cuscuta campestris TaxID=132261 RepID=A0A484KWN7_9ASTE|nr:unnamed protein product [Cuscuta campestris]